MIKLEQVNKYFNKRKKNEIHVIKNNNLSFDKNGLVALLGQSGSGKTTLLNVIGGLSKVSSGNIYINNERITKRNSYKIDEIRNMNIGYIFQDYKLVENMTVYENVALSLKILGIKDKEEIKKRVLYTLEKVNMLRYKNRFVSMLSGGERQRVGIARAIVKNPKIVLADEPTGNLDSKNSIEIMNIIKSISKNFLVILVTHEKELAEFYADRIICLQDGEVIKDYENHFDKTLNYKIENNIYLKDFKSIDNIQKDNINITVYRDNSEKLDIKLVFKNGNIYIESDTKEKLETIDSNTNIKLINDHYKEIKSLNITDDNFDIASISASCKEKYSSIFKFGEILKDGFQKVFDYSILKKILLGGFFLSGMFAFYGISSIFGAINIEDKDFISMNKEYLTGRVNNISISDYEKIENNAHTNYIFPNNSLIRLRLEYNKYLQTSGNYGFIIGSLSSINMLNEKDLILGKMPSNSNEIVIDKLSLNNFIENNNTKRVGFNKIEDLLNQNVKVNNMPDLKIVGITDKEEPNIYTHDELFINIISNTTNSGNSEEIYDPYMEDIHNEDVLIDYNLVINNKIKLKEGNLPINDYEVIVHINDKYDMPIGKTIKNTINNKKLKVVGYYENIGFNNYTNLFVNNKMIKYTLIEKSNNITVYSKNMDESLEYLSDMNLHLKKSYEYDKQAYISNQKDEIISTLIVSFVTLGISLIEILLMIRSSFLSRIKEVGIFRAIGIKKSDIYKMFTGEIFAITTIASVPGISFMAYILFNISKFSYLEGKFMVNIYTLLFSFVLIFIFNILVGIIPVFNTIRKTPADILARIDVD